ncbi:butyrophilin subfamily 1 member A1-like isoform X3 [Triplophysa rosa]|uniref:Butyrophilin subfamily 1 member A1-like n=1 Tax=Triplophysa rosa TaxID=992332 RepID=A0A9W7TV36_TRIRA|nr:butyrophilin subfamily 1 member A1-like isoform X3 [Triplophysa rosa]KAI7803456.1 putative butyrophilin subfamily 1 member A1-like [Triplophysa rosa]
MCNSGVMFICGTLLIVGGITSSRADKFDVAGPAVPLMAVSGEDVILPCSVKPNISAVNMRVEWSRLDQRGSVVHLYEDHEDRITDQLPSYRGRTRLFKDELEKGNTSLKLSRVQTSDEGLYKCFVQSKSWSDDTTVDIWVEAVGSAPVITVDGFDGSGGLHLQCESKGWNPEPDLVWLDSEGVTLTSESTDTHRDDTDGFSVKHAITVYNSDTKYHCRVKLRHHMLETEIITSNKMFNSWRALVVLISIGVVLSVITGILITVFAHRKREHYQFSQSQRTSVQNVITHFRKHAVNVTLDSNVAHPRLIMSRDGKQVRDGHKPENVENGDEEQNERFSICLCVLGQEGFTSDFYYEVQVKGKTEWDLGVTRESINKKEKVSLKPADGRWTMGLREGIYRACGYPYVSLSLRRKLQRVGVFVNYKEGRVSFYDVEAMCHIYTYSGQCFNERLRPFFCLGPYWRENSTVPLIICNDL